MLEPNRVESPQTTGNADDQGRSENVRAIAGWRLIDLAMDWPVLALLVAIVFGIVVFGTA